MTQADANVELIAPLSDAEAEAAFIALVTLLDGFGCCPAATVNGKEDDGLSINLHFSTTRARTLIAALNTRVEPTLHPLPSEGNYSCPICSDHSTWSGDAALSFCAKHYRQYLATFQIHPKDLDAYRAERIAMQRSTPTAPVQGDDEAALDAWMDRTKAKLAAALPVQGDDAEWSPRAMLLRRRADAESQGGSAEISVEEIDALLDRLSGDNNTALVEALTELAETVEQAFPALAHTPPMVRAREVLASITSTDADGGRR